MAATNTSLRAILVALISCIFAALVYAAYSTADSSSLKKTYSDNAAGEQAVGKTSQGSELVFWLEHGNRKIWPEQTPSFSALKTKQSINIFAAKNEWEPFQLGIYRPKAASPSEVELKVSLSLFTNSAGDTLPAATIYKQHSLNIEKTPNKKYGHLGLAPDALVPLINPVSGEPTAGLYGGDEIMPKAGLTQGLWFDVYVPESAPAGEYQAQLRIQAGEETLAQLPVNFTVQNFSLPKQRALKACFQLDVDSVRFSHRLKNIDQAKHLTSRYERLMHRHGIDNWSPNTGFNYGLNGVKIKVRNQRLEIDWSEFDRNVSAAMDGSAFPDGRPAQCLFVPYWMPIRNHDGSITTRATEQNYQGLDKNLFAQWINALQAHLKEKGWLDRALVFYFDEPFLQAWKYQGFVNAAKVIREAAPELKIMLTDGYRGADAYAGKGYIDEPVDRYVDVWNPVTFQVSTPERLAFYRERRVRGEQNMWCQTVGSANKTKPFLNLFLDYDMPFHRMWGVLSWDMGFTALEMWQTIIWYDEQNRQALDIWNDPKGFPGFQQPVNGDGRLFYPGTPEAIGGNHHIPISSIRLKAVREAIEDYQYLKLLKSAGKIDQFDISRLHATNNKDKNKMRQPMATGRGNWRFWEGDPDAFMEARQEMARLLSTP